MNPALLTLIVIINVVIQAIHAPAHADDTDELMDFSEKMAKKIAATPSQELPPLPEIETKVVGDPSNFPALPPSESCEPKDLKGLFKLNAVFEEPQAAETMGFQTNPNQYILFHPNTLFMRINVGDEILAPKEVYNKMVEHTENNMQYVLQDNGFVYFYLDRVAVDVKACFVVVKDQSPFKAGQVLLLPPKGQITGRLVHSYDVIEQKKKGGAKQNANVVPQGKNSAEQRAYRKRLQQIKKAKKKSRKKRKR